MQALPEEIERRIAAMTTGDKLHYLARMAPEDVRAIDQIITYCLQRAWPTQRKMLKVLHERRWPHTA